MLGLGYRQEMKQWDLAKFPVNFWEVAPENWVGADLSILQNFKDVRFHGVALNLGGIHPINFDFLSDIKALIQKLNITYYSDHLALSGDPHLYDLFPVPFTKKEVIRVADRIKSVQDFLGMRIAIENTTYYTNIGELTEYDFLSRVVETADCNILLDVNNIIVNWRNHKQVSPYQFFDHVDHNRITYLHIAAPHYDDRFSMWLDSHSGVPSSLCTSLAATLKKDMLFEWDNHIKEECIVLEEVCKISLTI